MMMFVPGDSMLHSLSAKHNPPHMMIQSTLVKFSGLHTKMWHKN